MELDTLPAELILNHPPSVLGQVCLDWHPQPGTYLEFKGQTYVVLERRHRYLLRSGRYQLHKIALHVQTFDAPADVSLIDGRWVIGDITCVYNARSELLRCAVNPNGSCDRCTHYQSF